MKKSLLLTRGLADSEALARELAPHGITCLIQPMLTYIYQPNAQAEMDRYLAEDIQGIVLTSRHAVHELTMPNNIPVYAVGEGTAQAAQNQGADTVQTIAGGGNVASLIRILRSKLTPQDGALLYLRGRDITADLVGSLAPITVHECVTYQADLATVLYDDTIQAIESGSVNGVALMSAHTAEAFAQAAKTQGVSLKNLTAYCLSHAIAQTLSATQWRQILTSNSAKKNGYVEWLAAKCE